MTLISTLTIIFIEINTEAKERYVTTVLETERLILRTWHDNDVQLMLTINQDPLVMSYFPSLQNFQTTQYFINMAKIHFKIHGYSTNAIVRKDNGEFIGFIGLHKVDFESHFTPATEICWRLSSKHWGQGFATEGALAVLDNAFRVLKIPNIVSFTSIDNAKSINVMQKIGLHHNKNGNFNHPKLTEDSCLREHVLYQLNRTKYLSDT